MVVDDDDDIRETLAGLLEDEGYRVAAYTTGQDALEALKAGLEPRVILLDLMMPVMDGWQFAAELRKRDEDIPIILLSAARDLRTHAKALSAAEIIEKPFDLSELLPKIARVASAA
jgi:CheY-like chemotaxis protein